MSKFCGFCKKNGEIESFWQSHGLRDENDLITCPVLKKYQCPCCGEVGKHTASYCPQASPATSRSKPEVVNKKSSASASKRPALQQKSGVKALQASCLTNQHSRQQQQQQIKLQQPIKSQQPIKLQQPIHQQLMRQQQQQQNLKQLQVLRQQEQAPKLDLSSIPPYFVNSKDTNLVTIVKTLKAAQLIRPQDRLLFLYRLGYNPLRYEFIRQAAYIADYTIIQLGV